MLSPIRLTASLAAFLIAFSCTTSPVDAAASRGLAWGTDNRFAKSLAKGSVDWYHHWQDKSVPQMPNHIEYVPMYWGPRYNGLWNSIKKNFHKTKPKYVLAFNEPDVAGQANLSPSGAASLFMKELQPLRKQGIKVSSPQIVWNTQWMDSFLKELRKRGGDVDFMAVHYYGSWKDTGRLKKWIKTIRKKYHKNIWLTEYGVTASSGGSAAQIKNFQNQVTNWMDSVGYVDRVAWLGCFTVNNPPDAYASRQNAMLSSGAKLRSIGYSFVYNGGHKKRAIGDDSQEEAHQAPVARATPGAKRHSLQHHRRIIGLQDAVEAQLKNATLPLTINGFPATAEEVQDWLAHTGDDDADDDKDDDSGKGDECDEYCQKRDALTTDGEADDDDHDEKHT